MDLLKSLSYPEEILALIKFKLGRCESVQPKIQTGLRESLCTCYKLLNATSRSFAAVIQALEGDLRDAVCIFYLVLRALDTVEDDMTIANDEKIPMLKAFHTYLQDADWTYTRSQEKDRAVLELFPQISYEFSQLAPMYQEVISEICEKMGAGMIKYLDVAPDALQDWDEYCHYVAGLVGIGLSRLFSASQQEAALVGEDTALSNSMGLFLQKTNIIRDYLEDVRDGRHFWPKQAWSKHTAALEGFALADHRPAAMLCLNELI